MKILCESLNQSEFFGNYIVELAGIFTEILLLSILVPIIIWIYNIRENHFRKFNALMVLFDGCNKIFEQYVTLLQFEKIEDNKIPNPVMRYWLLFQDDEIKHGYFASQLYGNIAIKAICVEHCTYHMLSPKEKSSVRVPEGKISQGQIDARNNGEKNCSLLKEKDKLQTIVDNIELELSSFEKYLFYPIDKKNIAEQFNLLKISFHLTSENIEKFIKDDSDTNKNQLIESINTCSIATLEIFYRNVNFITNYDKLRTINYELLTNQTTTRDELLNRYVELDKKNMKQSFGWGEFLLLLEVIKRNFRK